MSDKALRKIRVYCLFYFKTPDNYVNNATVTDIMLMFARVWRDVERNSHGLF
jgi:hypothetical protein